MTALNFPANPSNGDVYENYQYDGTDGVWKRLPSSSLGINGLADVTITTPADGESLVYDNATGEWINADATVEVYGVDTAETSYFSLPKGTDAQRPVSPSNGDIRFNTTSGSPEWYSAENDRWVLFRSDPSISVEYLVIAGGGSGGIGRAVGNEQRGGGGGAGGYRTSVGTSGGGASAESSLSLTTGTYTVTVGAGGASVTAENAVGLLGGNSVFSTITSFGGGGGGSNTGAALTGGSGGGSGGSTAGSGTTSQGFDGGGSTTDGGGGGGGAGAVGVTATVNDTGADGGAGVASSITGSSVTRAGGGGGAGTDGGSGDGGVGGGGNGGRNGAPPQNGTANTGGGGGGMTRPDADPLGSPSGSGGSGVVIIKYPAAYTATPTVGLTSSTSTVGDFKVTTFTAGTGTVTFS